jgi:preprotein translocase subunit Sec63
MGAGGICGCSGDTALKKGEIMQRGKKEKSLYERLSAARKTLGIGKEATVDEIKDAFRARIRRHHPDKVTTNNESQNTEAQKIIAAYKEIMAYCRNYRISFSKQTADQYRSEEEFWTERFGNDPMWGSGA